MSYFPDYSAFIQRSRPARAMRLQTTDSLITKTLFCSYVRRTHYNGLYAITLRYTLLPSKLSKVVISLRWLLSLQIIWQVSPIENFDISMIYHYSGPGSVSNTQLPTFPTPLPFQTALYYFIWRFPSVKKRSWLNLLIYSGGGPT